LRLFNDSSDLVNLQQNPGGKRPEKSKEKKVEEESKEAVRLRNSSSPESDAAPANGEEGDEDFDGGAKIEGDA
jgi:hypothetical protein